MIRRQRTMMVFNDLTTIHDIITLQALLAASRSILQHLLNIVRRITSLSMIARDSS